MLKLNARLRTRLSAEPFVAKVVTDNNELEDHSKSAYLIRERGQAPPRGYRAYLDLAGVDAADETASGAYAAALPQSLEYLSQGDIVRISPQVGELWVMYRRSSPFNAMLLTEQCNSDCLMCSQPPKPHNDRYLVDAYLEAIPLMDPATLELGITGGEPTLLGDRLFEIIERCRENLPATALHMLTNGRMFQYLRLAHRLGQLQHPDLVLGVPVYSDLAGQHDFVVQAKGAFDQTIRGILNLARCGIRVELRVVLHAQTIDRLPQLAEFLARNLPFVSHVALMGLEMMGYVRMNMDALWCDSVDYQAQLVRAVEILDRSGLNISIYNHQLCVLPTALWPFARKSISDWKNEYANECQQCAVRERCGGFFSSATVRRSRAIQPFDTDPCPPKTPFTASDILEPASESITP